LPWLQSSKQAEKGKSKNAEKAIDALIFCDKVPAANLDFRSGYTVCTVETQFKDLETLHWRGGDTVTQFFIAISPLREIAFTSEQ